MYAENSKKSYAIKTEVMDENIPDFDPSEFIGILSHHHFDLENELQEIRNLWPGDLF